MMFASCVAVGDARIVTEDEERGIGMRAIVEKYSPDFVDCPPYERIMRGMPAVTIFAVKVEELCGKANKGMLNIDMAEMMRRGGQH